MLEDLSGRHLFSSLWLVCEAQAQHPNWAFAPAIHKAGQNIARN